MFADVTKGGVAEQIAAMLGFGFQEVDIRQAHLLKKMG